MDMSEQQLNGDNEVSMLDSTTAQEFRPSEFMRARRPELFSDSKIISEPRLTREILEYHLETLTSRKEETVFEYFARRLAEKEVCPNLVPQTGPTGGGDSKVDTETYPVAKGISLRWYEGLEKGADSERWAFAFSAKKDWRSKVRSDVKKIYQTGRDYKKIFFITSQFVPDKKRVEVEDDLKKKHDIPVRILDRTWIVAAVFERGRLALAIETLNLQGYDELERKVVGPLDFEREAELTELDEQIADSARYEGVDYQLAEDCLQSALLARALGRPRTEVEGRFQRAEAISERLDHRQQRLRIAYHKASTAFWWYEDFETLNRLYDEIEQFAINSKQVTDIELLRNAWSWLKQLVKTGQRDPSVANFEARTKTLKAEFERLASDGSRPNNAVLARTHLLLIALAEEAGNKQPEDEILTSLRNTIEETEGLTSYPLEAIADIVRKLGDNFTASAKYDELFETIIRLIERRTSQAVTGQMLLERGYQKLSGGQTDDAIRLLGRAQQRLALLETRQEMIAALVGCGLAYEAAGLLWAARANVIAATDRAYSEYAEHGAILPEVLSSLRKLVWIELQLGRIAWVLEWMELALGIAQQLLRTEEQKQLFLEERELQDSILAILFLKTDFDELQWLEFLPDVLGRYHLLYSRMALLYALGYENVLRSEGAIPENETEEDVRKIFVDLRNQPASADLPERPELSQKSIAQLKSFVAGCEVTVDAANNLQSVQLGEIILAALESLLATNLYSELLPHASRLTIHVQPDGPSDEWPIYNTHQRDLFPSIELEHSSRLTEQIRNDHVGFRGWLEKFIIEAMLQIVFVPDVMSWALRLVRGEGVLDRALNFSETIIPVQSILGEQPRVRLSDWKSEGTSNRFQLQRTVPWDQGMESSRTLAVEQSSMPHSEPGEVSAEPFDINKLKHKDRRVYSLVNFPLWDEAKWRGISYMISSDMSWEPRVALNFENPEAAKRIFRGWLDELGQTDRNEALRISIITGIDSDRPFSYMVVIGVNPPVKRNDTSSSSYVLISRWLRMDPLNSQGLDTFRERYSQMKKYVLIPANWEDPPKQPTPFFDFGINKTQIRIVPAWQLSEHDPDVIAIEDDANPIIPDGIEKAPILRAITSKKGRKQRAEAEEDRLSKLLELLGHGAEELASDRKALQKIFKYLSKGQIKGDWSCYCGSGKKLKQCHLNELDQLQREIDVATAKSLLKKITLMERTTTD